MGDILDLRTLLFLWKLIIQLLEQLFHINARDNFLKQIIRFFLNKSYW